MLNCPTCGKTLSSEHGVKCHHKSVHGETLKNTMTCERCGEDFECWPSQEEETRQCSECFQEYIVVGSELPSDIHIPWNEREKLVSVVE